ncbi:MAG: RNA-binding cell elongation regulator Jag/EloR [Butyricicoccaceae bacterium]
MTKIVEKQAATVDEAIAKALAELEVARDTEGVSVEVLERGKKGFLGIGAVPASVRVTYEIAEQEKTPAEQAKEFVEGLLERMNIKGQVALSEGEEGQILLDISGEDMGAVIGRRGDTLDAIQYLTSLCINRGREEHIRISINTEGYREKREESLQRLARKMAGKVLKYRKNMTLEPMNPYERRIIHAALQDYKGVTTYSTGTEPNRRVVVALDRTAARPPRSGGGYRPRRPRKQQQDTKPTVKTAGTSNGAAIEERRFGC